jgi:tRNA A37 threonylcarbamoyltransferase TsaD
MERLRAVVLAILLLGGGAVALAACEERGPFERAGEAADEAVGDARRAVDDAVD